MKTTLLLFILLFFTGNAYSRLEWEILNAGFAIGVSEDEYGLSIKPYEKPEMGLTMGTEVRYNMPDRKFSFGGKFVFTGWNRHDEDGDYVYHQNPKAFMVLADYNWANLLPNKITPFAGVGLGLSFNREYSWTSREPYDFPGIRFRRHIAFSPRVGMEFFRRIRLTAEYMYMGYSCNFLNTRIGFVIGS
jgi:hypothetical protein